MRTAFFFPFFSPFFFLVALLPLAFIIWGVVDAAGHSDAAWAAAGQNKVLWIVLQAVGVFFCMVGLIFTIVYFAAIRPRVVAGGLPPPVA